MAKKNPKSSSVKITCETRDLLEARRICPGCAEHALIAKVRMIPDRYNPGESRFGGRYLACSGPHGHKCCSVTSATEKKAAYVNYGPKAKRDNVAA